LIGRVYAAPVLHICIVCIFESWIQPVLPNFVRPDIRHLAALGNECAENRGHSEKREWNKMIALFDLTRKPLAF
jgi:hypothetical protein